MPGHDFTPINLAYTNKAAARRFSAEILDGMMAEALPIADDLTPKRLRGRDVLGRSPITEANTEGAQKGAYKPPHGYHYLRFASLLAKDPTFQDFLTKRGIDPSTAHERAEEARARLRICHATGLDSSGAATSSSAEPRQSPPGPARRPPPERGTRLDGSLQRHRHYACLCLLITF
jgi:hypothetical protein